MAKYVVLLVEDDQVEGVLNEIGEWESVNHWQGARVAAVMELSSLHIAGQMKEGIIYD
jgi:hypothetical protein